MFAAFGAVGVLFTVWMAVEAVRRGQTQSWLWIILFFGPIGAAVYFFSEVMPIRVGGSWGGRKVTVQDEQRALADVKRLDNPGAWASYAGVLRARGQFAKAADAGQQAVRRDPNSVDARYELGLALLGGNRAGEAVEQLSAVVARDRAYQSGDALFALAQAQEGAGDVPAARESLEALATSSGRPEILFRLARVQGLMGDRAAAVRSLKRIIDEADYVPDYLQRDVKPWVKKARKAIAQLGGEAA